MSNPQQYEEMSAAQKTHVLRQIIEHGSGKTVQQFLDEQHRKHTDAQHTGGTHMSPSNPTAPGKYRSDAERQAAKARLAQAQKDLQARKAKKK